MNLTKHFVSVLSPNGLSVCLEHDVYENYVVNPTPSIVSTVRERFDREVSGVPLQLRRWSARSALCMVWTH